MRPRPLAALAALALLAAPALASAQAVTQCVNGERVVDREGKVGTVVSAGGPLCTVRYDDGQTYGWIYWNLRPAQAVKPSSPVKPPAVTVLRPGAGHALVYRAGPTGHVLLTAEVGGAPVRFLVDTGASLVFLSPKDARAVGIDPDALAFTEAVHTGNGTVRAAPLVLPEVSIGQLAIENVAAAVLDNLDQSVLGMSFLGRLKGFAMREGTLTLDW